MSDDRVRWLVIIAGIVLACAAVVIVGEFFGPTFPEF